LRVARVDLALGSLAAFVSVLNLLDLATSSVGLQSGFREGNFVALGLSAALDVGTLGSLVILKVVFVAAVALVALAGVRARDGRAKNLVLASLLTSAVVFSAVSLNNLYWVL